MSNWLIKAIEAKYPRLSVALADSVPLKIEGNWFNTRELVAGDIKTLEERN
jgi:hypothetical protein